MMPFVTLPRIVIDTNVFVSALMSQRGAAYKLFMLLGSGQFASHFSVPLAIEYEDVSKRPGGKIILPPHQIDDILDYVLSVSQHNRVYYLWRPFLNDPKDDMVLELAVAAGCEIIVTYNKKDFRGVEQFGIRLLTPQEFLQEIGELL